MKNKLQLLVMPLDGESTDQSVKKALAQLNQLSEIKVKWEAIEKMDKEDYKFVVELEKFHEEFSYYWHLSSPKIIACFGEKLCYEIFEQFLKWKDGVWDYAALNYYQRLPEEITIFRGGAGSIQQIVGGHSWTLNRDLAINYAKQCDGIVISALLAKMDVLFLVSEEEEIIPRRESLSNILCVCVA